VIEQGDIRIRRATADDVDFLVELANHDDVRPFLAARAVFDHERIASAVAEQEADPHRSGRFVIEVRVDGEWCRAGSMSFRVENERSRIAHLGALAVHPDFRGRRLADDAARIFQRHLIFDLGYHRLEMTVYGFNERAQAHAERAGWVKEGVQRNAYRRDEGWTDGVLYGIVREDFDE
jgi:RimJ/RimL family protein N-acetyltransferase